MANLVGGPFNGKETKDGIWNKDEHREYAMRLEINGRWCTMAAVYGKPAHTNDFVFAMLSIDRPELEEKFGEDWVREFGIK